VPTRARPAAAAARSFVRSGSFALEWPAAAMTRLSSLDTSAATFWISSLVIDGTMRSTRPSSAAIPGIASPVR